MEAGRVARAMSLVVIALALAGCSLVEGLLPQRPVMSREQAIAAAKVAEPGWASEGVLSADLGTWGELGEESAPIEGPRPHATDDVWSVRLGSQLGPLNGRGVIVILDARDGHVIQRASWVS